MLSFRPERSPVLEIYSVNFKNRAQRSGGTCLPIGRSVNTEYLFLNKNTVKHTLYPLTDPHSANRSGQALGSYRRSG